MHPLLEPPEEGVHELADDGTPRVDDDPDLAPGHDCCAVCASPLNPDVQCTACESVHYCSPQHLVDDAPNHARVCDLLRCMRGAARLPGRRPDDGGGEEPAAAAARDARDGEGAASGASPAARPPASEAEEFGRPDGERHGWSHVAPARFHSVLSGSDKGSGAGAGREGSRSAGAGSASGSDSDEEDGEAGPARKRPRRDATAAAAAAAAPGATEARPQRPQAAQPGEPRHATASAATADNMDDTCLQLADELADRTALLTYPYTAAFALLTAPHARGAARRAAAGGRPLELVVLGAAEDAELAELPAWQLVADALDQEVRILFVGPQVPDGLAGTEARHGRCAMRFVQSTYEGARGGGPSGAGPSRAAAGRPSSAPPAPPPDVYLAFNPGFTCPDYDWTCTLEALTRAAERPVVVVGGGGGGGAGGGSGSTHGAAAGGAPCLVVATNTRMEALMEQELLREYGLHPAAPLTRNPYTSLRTAQSGTLANDLYRKNAWFVVYQHRKERVKPAVNKRRRHGGKVAKAVAERMARAMYDKLVAPVARLIRRR